MSGVDARVGITPTTPRRAASTPLLASPQAAVGTAPISVDIPGVAEPVRADGCLSAAETRPT
jgi:hypothetical protein